MHFSEHWFLGDGLYVLRRKDKGYENTGNRSTTIHFPCLTKVRSINIVRSPSLSWGCITNVTSITRLTTQSPFGRMKSRCITKATTITEVTTQSPALLRRMKKVRSVTKVTSITRVTAPSPSEIMKSGCIARVMGITMWSALFQSVSRKKSSCFTKMTSSAARHYL